MRSINIRRCPKALPDEGNPRPEPPSPFPMRQSAPSIMRRRISIPHRYRVPNSRPEISHGNFPSRRSRVSTQKPARSVSRMQYGRKRAARKAPSCRSAPKPLKSIENIRRSHDLSRSFPFRRFQRADCTRSPCAGTAMSPPPDTVHTASAAFPHGAISYRYPREITIPSD